jgi:hypothetical protein
MERHCWKLNKCSNLEKALNQQEELRVLVKQTISMVSDRLLKEENSDLELLQEIQDQFIRLNSPRNKKLKSSRHKLLNQTKKAQEVKTKMLQQPLFPNQRITPK